MDNVIQTEDLFRKHQIFDAFIKAQTHNNRSFKKHPKISDKCMKQALQTSSLEKCAEAISAHRGRFIRALARGGNAIIEDENGAPWILIGTDPTENVIDCSKYDSSQKWGMGENGVLTFVQARASKLIGELNPQV